MNFAALGLAPQLLHAAKKCGFQQLTPVQEQAIPPARRGRDMLVTAQTGTGKTAAYGFALLQQLLDKPRKVQPGKVRALVLTPTRELTEQVADNLQQYAQFTELKVAAVYGGVKHATQANRLEAGLDILVATPGRLQEHLELKHTDLSQVEFLILDEADRILDMGFVGEISKLLAVMGKKPQVMFFSATLTQQVNLLANEILQRPLTLAITKRNSVADTVEHQLYPVDQARKYELFIHLLHEHNWFQVMVFSSTREEADKLIAALKEDKVNAAVIHSEKTQGARRRALKDFKEGNLQVLVATEVAARGLDIEGLDYVVNLDLPFFIEDYVHRVGRTGRAGSKGLAISLVSSADEHKVSLIEKAIGTKIKRVKIKGFEVTESALEVGTAKSRFANATDSTAKAKAAPAKKAPKANGRPAKPGSKAAGSKPTTKGGAKPAAKPVGKRAPSVKSLGKKPRAR